MPHTRAWYRPEPVLEVGQRLGEYEILAPIQTGGMARLFRARRLGAHGFRREVAIKCVHPDLHGEPSYTHMLVDEALMTARIAHPNVIRVDDLVEHDGACFLVMEYVDGFSLGEVLDALVDRGRAMGEALATHVATEVAAGLHAAHEATHPDGRRLDLVHRDVSPPNVLLTRDGHVKVIDFGVAKASGRGVRTTAGTIKGKFRYMSPEQARGKPVDRRTDVYALGIVLWEMLVMRPLFDADDEIELLTQVREPKVNAPGTLVSGISPALDEAVLAALAPAADDRPATAQSLRRMLARAVPEAAVVDSSDVAALLRELMGEAEAEPRSVLGELTVKRHAGAAE